MNAPAETVRSLPTDPDKLLTEEQVAQYFGLSRRTLKLWRYQGRGPEYVRLAANVVRYRWGAILDFNSQQSALSTSQESARKLDAA